ncbi:unnamed protein product [Moneuplotes crassus]|uniref:Uncharacterized protein n=1 Tax=Euplotes crassus TaxID=5936 RepID=A0AAD2CVP1_EUPCR|nr:unnamed protein product [Moneuplotes crassus]
MELLEDRNKQMAIYRKELLLEDKVANSLMCQIRGTLGSVPSVLSKTETMTEISFMKLRLAKESDRKILKRLRNFRLHSLKGLCLMDVKKDTHIIKEFLLKCVPRHKMSRFSITRPNIFFGRIYHFSQELSRIANFTTCVFHIMNFKVSLPLFSRFLVSGRECRQKVEFNNCRILKSKAIAFGSSLEKAKLTNLSLPGCGSWDCGDWKRDPKVLYILLDCLCSSDYLKRNLSGIHITPADFDKGRIKYYLAFKGFQLMY